MRTGGLAAILAAGAMLLGGHAHAGPPGKGDIAGISAGALGTAYFLGHWGMGAADACADGDTMSFYDSTAWAVTNGGGNPVEAIGVWAIVDGALVVVHADLGSPTGSEVATGVISEAGDQYFVLNAEMLRGGSETLFRCPDY